ncbi:hypothetical protein BGZ63DRAFT_195670 [Mariannaea sp. PMI_226]|nr:hypothetical protein BGZ63DRAFT_195670 [Mariannaea sp. PMI_226]
MELAKPTREKRAKQPHTRSQTGCRTCRSRRVKCDGDRPSCSRCIKAGRFCDFGIPNLPLRDRRALPLPGQQAWFVHSNQLQPIFWHTPLESNSIDPFESLEVKLPFKSKELLRYFHHSLDALEPCPQWKDIDILPFLYQNPDALRNTLLVAGPHYAWIVGDMQAFETTFLYHKIETIRLLNEWLDRPQPGGLATVMTQITTLCLAECAFGNMAAAETHLDGLMTVIDLHRPLNSAIDVATEPGEDLAYRYLIIMCHLLYGIKSRIHSSKILRSIFRRHRVANFMELVSLLHDWHDQDIGCLEQRLKAVALTPFFFGALPQGARIHAVDGFTIIKCLRVVTQSTCPPHQKHVRSDPSWVWAEGSASRLDLAIVDSHVESLFGPDKLDPKSDSLGQRLMTSWTGIAITAGLYLHCILDLWNAGEPIDHRLFRRLMTMLMHDLEQSVDDEVKDEYSSNLWFWKVFIGACSLEWHQMCAYDPAVQTLSACFDAFIKTWSQISKVSRWVEAERRLLKIAWPTTPAQDMAERVWHRVIKQARNCDYHTG